VAVVIAQASRLSNAPRGSILWGMSWCRIALVVTVSGSVVLACGFSREGALDVAAEGGMATAGEHDGGDADGASTTDAASGADGGSNGVPVCDPATCALPAPPAGWELILLGASRADACPTGFDTAEAIENPVAGADACACAACVKTGTTCSTGSITTKTDNGGGACGTTSSALDALGGACKNGGGAFGQDDVVFAPAPVKGTCTSVASPVPANVVSQPLRLCTRAASGCVGAACGAPPSMKACIATTGDVACPSGTKHLVAADVTLACPSCSCSIAAATCGGALDFYPQQDCAGTPVTLTSGVCKATGGGFQSYKWKGVVASEVCATAPVAPAVTLMAPQTICCP
jgi:hypothetical protein